MAAAVASKVSKFCSPCDQVVIPPEYCPAAVEDYYTLGPDIDRKARTLKAKKHLSAIGWTFYYALIKSGTKRELKYCSPTGKVFHSLLTACKSTTTTTTNLNTHIAPRSKGGTKRKCKPRSTKRVIRESPDSHLQTSTPRTVLSWLIDSGAIPPMARVEYRGKNGISIAEGRLAREGVECTCCGSVFTLTKFEAHAGSTIHHPSAHMFLEDGRSLMECMMRLRDEKKKTVGPAKDFNDDACSVCRDGGDLVLCDSCPSSFHTECLGLKEELLPEGDWFCPSCCCRICGKNDKNEDCSVLACVQCEHRYHEECLRSKGIAKCYSGGYWFCQDTCRQIFRSLQKILGKPIPVGTSGLTWTLLKYTKSDSHDERSLESYGKLNVALSVMHECFEPVKQAANGRDLVEDVIFSKWSELNRLNFRGFYTLVLEKNDDMISAAALRIHGDRVAEVPLVATRSKYRRLGMCRILMDELEKKLVELGVENLVLPAVRSALDIWTNSFGFSEMEKAERLKFVDCTFLDFQGTTMCKKALTRNEGKKNEECLEHVSKKVRVAFDDISEMTEFLLGEQVVEEETEFIDQKSTWWIDELLNI